MVNIYILWLWLCGLFCVLISIYHCPCHYMRLQDKYLMSHVKTMWRCQNITTLCPGLQRDQHLTVNTTHNCFHYRSITQGNSSAQLYGIIRIASKKRKRHIFNITLLIHSLHELSNVNRSQVWYITKINCVSWYIVTMTISPTILLIFVLDIKNTNILQVICYQHRPAITQCAEK